MDGEAIALFFGCWSKDEHIQMERSHQKGAESSSEGQEVLATTMARIMALWRFKKAERFRDRVRRRQVVRKSGGS